MPPPTLPSIPARNGDAKAYERAIRRQVLNPIIRETETAIRAAGNDYAAIQAAIRRIPQSAALQGLSMQAAAQQAQRLLQYHNSRFEKAMARSLGVRVEPMGQTLGINVLMSNHIDNNISLISTIPSRYQSSLALDFKIAAADAPFDEQRIIEILANNYRSTGWNARRIARDQTSKLVGQLNMERQTEVGVTEYIWRTVEDRRVRQSHRANNGRKFTWSDGPAFTGHPGEDIMCRCRAEGIIPDQGLSPLEAQLAANAEQDGFFDGVQGVAGLLDQDAEGSGNPAMRALARLIYANDLQMHRMNYREFLNLEGDPMLRAVGNADWVDDNLNGNFFGDGVFGRGLYFGYGDELGKAFNYVEPDLDKAAFMSVRPVRPLRLLHDPFDAIDHPIFNDWDVFKAELQRRYLRMTDEIAESAFRPFFDKGFEYRVLMLGYDGIDTGEEIGERLIWNLDKLGVDAGLADPTKLKRALSHMYGYDGTAITPSVRESILDVVQERGPAPVAGGLSKRMAVGQIVDTVNAEYDYVYKVRRVGDLYGYSLYRPNGTLVSNLQPKYKTRNGLDSAIQRHIIAGRSIRKKWYEENVSKETQPVPATPSAVRPEATAPFDPLRRALEDADVVLTAAEAEARRTAIAETYRGNLYIDSTTGYYYGFVKRDSEVELTVFRPSGTVEGRRVFTSSDDLAQWIIEDVDAHVDSRLDWVFAHKAELPPETRVAIIEGGGEAYPHPILPGRLELKSILDDVFDLPLTPQSVAPIGLYSIQETVTAEFGYIYEVFQKDGRWGWRFLRPDGTLVSVKEAQWKTRNGLNNAMNQHIVAGRSIRKKWYEENVLVW